MPTSENQDGDTLAGEPAAFLPLHPDALKVALWAGAISYVVWMVVFTFGLFLSIFGGLRLFLIGSIAWFGFASLFAFLSFYWPRVRHRHVFYRASERGLEIRRGVLWQSHIFIARSRIQHTDVAQGPLQRHLDLARLIVHTAGTHNASTSLSGIHHKEALRVRELLTRDDGDNDRDDDGV